MKTDSIDRIRQARLLRDQREAQSASIRQNQQTEASNQQAIFESFKMMAEMFNSGQVKTSEVFRILESLEGKHKASKTEIEMIKAGLNTLEKQIGEIPVGDLKQLPKFLQQKDSVKVTNLDELKNLMSEVLEAIKAQETVVEAPVVNVPKPVVNVPAPIVNVDAPDMKPLEKGLESVKKAVEKNKYPEVVKTEQVNTLVSETFDQWKCIYDEFDPESEQVEAIVYYYKGKKVARINYTYDDNGRVISGKKA